MADLPATEKSDAPAQADALLAEVRGLRADLARVLVALEAIARHSGKASLLLSRFEPGEAILPITLGSVQPSAQSGSPFPGSCGAGSASSGPASPPGQQGPEADAVSP